MSNQKYLHILLPDIGGGKVAEITIDYEDIGYLHLLHAENSGKPKKKVMETTVYNSSTKKI